MNELNSVSFVLPNRLAAVTAAFADEVIVAFDGITNCVFIYKLNGRFHDKKELMRPYRKVHYDFSTCRFLALSGNNNRRVYFLDNRLYEIGSVNLNIDTTGDDQEDRMELMDASPDTRNGNSVIIATHRYSVRAYSINGDEIGFVRAIDTTRLGQDFVYSDQTEAFHYIRNNISFVSVKNRTENFTGSVPSVFSLRTLISDGNGSVYGLFGYQYIYNYILPIYKDGMFVLPSTEEAGNIIDQLSTGC